VSRRVLHSPAQVAEQYTSAPGWSTRWALSRRQEQQLRRLEHGGADRCGRGDQRPGQQDCRRGRRFRYASKRDGEDLAASRRSATAARSHSRSCASG